MSLKGFGGPQGRLTPVDSNYLFIDIITWVLTVCTLMKSSSVMAPLENPEVGILELRFQGLVPLKAGLHP